MVRLTLVAACALALAGPCAAQLPRTMLDEDFRLLAREIWVPATNGPWQAGAPDVTRLTQRDGRTVLEMTSTLTGPERRGYLTIPAFPARACTVEVDFCPLQGEDVPLELWLIFPFGDLLVAAGPCASGGERLVRLQSSAAGWVYQVPWDYGRWYRMVFRAGPMFRASLLDEHGVELWSRTYPWALCDYAPVWGVGVLQYAEAGHGPFVSRAAVDRVRMTLDCGADLDFDGRVTASDAALFVRHFAFPSCAADLDDDRNLTVNDFVAFQRALAMGCP